MRTRISSWAASKYFYPLASFVITLLAGLIRFLDLNSPSVLVFDETYYVKDAWTLGQNGTERAWPDNPNPNFESGMVDTYLDQAQYVVHPPIGKWVIYLGMMLFGADNSFGWRFSVALLGTLAIPLIIACARILTGSKVYATSAGLLLAIEGQSIVLSRTAILDGILAFFVLLAFYLLLRDQKSWLKKLRTAAALGQKLPLNYRPSLIAAGLVLGLATGTKWSGLYFVAFFGLFVAASEIGYRKALGASFGSGVLQSVFSFLSLVPISIGVYVIGWSGWIFGTNGWGRNPDKGWLIPLWDYHLNARGFHTGLSSEHNYEAGAFSWLINLRPTAFYFERYETATAACPIPQNCTIAVTALAHPLIWLAGLVCIICAIWIWIRKKDHSAGLIAVAFLAGWLPWAFFPERTTFQFYATVFAPYFVLAIVYVLHRSRRKAITRNRLEAAEKFQLRLLLISIAMFFFFASLWLGIPTTDWFWQIQMWLPSWV